MRRDAFEFLRRHIHFADNHKQKRQGETGYDPLFKVRYVLDEIGKGLKRVWSAGKNLSLDESMIKYCGRAIAFVQYMPAKPIKHGIKVFCLCCAYSAIMLSFEIYCGKDENKTDRTTVDICERLIHAADLVTGATGMIRGRTVYSDNYYRSIRMAKHLYEKYSWSLVGTIVPTDKKQRADEDVPFVKLSNGARNKLPRGWFREAYIKLTTPPPRKTHYIQCTTWRDKKQVMFLSNNRIGATDGLTVKRRIRGQQERATIREPQAHADYVQSMNGVDRNDRDSADYSTSIRTNRYYLRIFCSGLDRVVHAVYVVVCFLAKSGVGKREWGR